MRNIRGCNVVVVGGAGFLGSHLVNHLIDDRECDVLVVDNLCAGRREFIHREARFEHHDITGSEERLCGIFKSHAPHWKDGFYVFNYAAYPYIPDSFARPIYVNDVNYMGAMKVINAAQEAGANAILQVSSAEIYGNGDAGSGRLGDTYAGKAEDGTICGFKQLNEHSPVMPHSSYGVAKAAVDNWVQVRWREAKIPCIALRQFNCVGERETHPYIVPEIISQLSAQSNLPVKAGGHVGAVVKLGNNSFRDFLYAGDAVRIAVELLERGQFGEVYNLGSETGIKMYDLAKLIGKVMGFADVVVERDEARVRPWEIWHLQSDNTKIWKAVMSESMKDGGIGVSRSSDESGRAAVLTPLEAALRKTVEWYNNNGRKWAWER